MKASLKGRQCKDRKPEAKRPESTRTQKLERARYTLYAERRRSGRDQYFISQLSTVPIIAPGPLVDFEIREWNGAFGLAAWVG
jgi:hypothetical protein